MEEELTEKYLESLTDVEKIAMEIARQHLGSSFDISKSIGFLKYKSIHPSLPTAENLSK